MQSLFTLARDYGANRINVIYMQNKSSKGRKREMSQIENPISQNQLPSAFEITYFHRRNDYRDFVKRACRGGPSIKVVARDQSLF